MAEGDGGEREISTRTIKCLFLAALKWSSRADGFLIEFPKGWGWGWGRREL